MYSFCFLGINSFSRGCLALDFEEEPELLMCPSSPTEVFKWAWGRRFFRCKGVGDSWPEHICKKVEKLHGRTGIGVTVNDKRCLTVLHCKEKYNIAVESDNITEVHESFLLTSIFVLLPICLLVLCMG
jgi:hypothetical protein